ncbi:MAG: hypothetical protein ACOX47_05415 [Bacillota bacterium]|jgi:hypothetical protein
MSEQKILIIEIDPIIDSSVKELCLRPYPGHAKGCPNYNKKDTCPPNTKMFNEVFDLDYPVFAIINSFDLKSHKEKMHLKHPDWSEKQLASTRFWYAKAKKELRDGINKFLQDHRDYDATSCPEGLGVNVTETLKNVGILLKWPPEDIAYQVALAGRKLDAQSL